MLVDTLEEVLRQKVIAGAKEDEAHASYSDLVKQTGEPKYRISRWLKPALETGVVDNAQTEKGKAAALRLGQYRLGDGDVLPSIEPSWMPSARPAAGLIRLQGSQRSYCRRTPQVGPRNRRGVGTNRCSVAVLWWGMGRKISHQRRRAKRDCHGRPPGRRTDSLGAAADGRYGEV